MDRIKLQAYTTYTGHALEKVVYDFKQSRRFSDVSNKQVMILLTDGQYVYNEYILFREKRPFILRKLFVLIDLMIPESSRAMPKPSETWESRLLQWELHQQNRKS